MGPIFVTITGQNHYLGMKAYKVGRVVKLAKEPDNQFDESAIAVLLPYIDVIGYVANSINTVYAGTYSAGRLYDLIDECAYAEIMFITHSGAIARILSKEEMQEIAKTVGTEDMENASGTHIAGRKPALKIGF